MCSVLNSQKVLHKRVLLYFLAIMHTYYAQSAWYTVSVQQMVVTIMKLPW